MNNNHLNKTWRQAISYAINYSYIIDIIMEGRADRLKSPVPESILYGNSSLNVATLNITKAREIMQSMGFGIALNTSYPGPDESSWISATFATYNLSNS